VSIAAFQYQDRFAVFGEEDVNHGFIQIANIANGAEKVSVQSITLKVRECSASTGAPVPFHGFTLSSNTNIYSGVESWVDQERVVTFTMNVIQPANTTVTYTVFSDKADFQSSAYSDKQCFRMALERSGIITKTAVVGNFPIRLGAKTLVRSKPTVTLTAIGPTTNRVRTVADDVFRISITAGNQHEILQKVLAPLISGTASPGGYYQVVDEISNEVVGRGWLSSTANIAWKIFGGPAFGEFYFTAGTTRGFRIRVNSSVFNNSPPATPQVGQTPDNNTHSES